MNKFIRNIYIWILELEGRKEGRKLASLKEGVKKVYEVHFKTV